MPPSHYDELVSAEYSGVLFSADPQTGDLIHMIGYSLPDLLVQRGS